MDLHGETVMNEVIINGVRYVPSEPAQALTTNLAGVNIVKAVGGVQRFTLGVAYPAMRAPGKGADGYNDFVSADVLEKTAWRWISKGDIGLFHRDGMEGHAKPVESYIYRGPDWHIASPVDGKDYVVKAGDWMLGTIWDEYGWDLVEQGLVKGWSPEGGARRITPDATRLAQLRV